VQSAAEKPGLLKPTSAKKPKQTCSREQSRALAVVPVELIKAGYETLVEAGYAPEMA
jgi:ketol-acid reductoisomerase